MLLLLFILFNLLDNESVFFMNDEWYHTYN